MPKTHKRQAVTTSPLIRVGVLGAIVVGAMGTGLAPTTASATERVGSVTGVVAPLDCNKLFTIMINDEPQNESSRVELYRDLIVYPGSAGDGKMEIRNDGPTAATLTVAFANTTFKADPSAQFYQDFLFGGQSLTSIISDNFVIQTEKVGRGATALIDIGYSLPADIDYQYDMQAASMDFDLMITMAGYASATGVEQKVATPCVSSVDDSNSGQATQNAPSGTTATQNAPSGTTTRENAIAPLSTTHVNGYGTLFFVGALLLGGAALIFTRRRRAQREASGDDLPQSGPTSPLPE